MIVIHARNVHEALQRGLLLISEMGVRRDSRNGPVWMMPCPVTTVYDRPWERVVLWPERDANPFFHLYEALWMLAGRNDVAGPVRYARQMAEYSDDGVTFHGTYGHRWRKHFGRDQLTEIVHALNTNKNDRRCVLQMWDAERDLGRNGKDVPCNLTATFQISTTGLLDLTVFCRSNDIIWGAYGANAVHFSFLQEYVAIQLGVPMGTYTQVSVNWHAYDNDLYRRVIPIARCENLENPYREQVYYDPLEPLSDASIATLLHDADDGFSTPRLRTMSTFETMLRAHREYKLRGMESALRVLEKLDPRIDWIRAGVEWLRRRRKG